MSLLDQLGGVLQQYSNGGAPANREDAMLHYQQVASQTPPSVLAGALDRSSGRGRRARSGRTCRRCSGSRIRTSGRGF